MNMSLNSGHDAATSWMDNKTSNGGDSMLIQFVLISTLFWWQHLRCFFSRRKKNKRKHKVQKIIDVEYKSFTFIPEVWFADIVFWIAVRYSRVFQDLTPYQVTHPLSRQLLNTEANFAAVLMWRASFNNVRHFFLFLELADGCRYIISFITHLHPSTVKLRDNFYDCNCHVLYNHGWNYDLLPVCSDHQKSQRSRATCNVFQFYFVVSRDVRLRRGWVSEIRKWDFSKIVNLRLWRHVSFVHVLGCDCGPKRRYLYRLVYLFTTILSSQSPHRIDVSFKTQPEHIFKVGIYRGRKVHHLINWTSERLRAHLSN